MGVNLILCRRPRHQCSQELDSVFILCPQRPAQGQDCDDSGLNIFRGVGLSPDAVFDEHGDDEHQEPAEDAAKSGLKYWIHYFGLIERCWMLPHSGRIVKQIGRLHFNYDLYQ